MNGWYLFWDFYKKAIGSDKKWQIFQKYLPFIFYKKRK